MPDDAHAETARARELRRNATDPERYLWSLLRNRKLAGLKFRRQAPVGPFVVDFHCESARLAVELDGASHDGRGSYDKRRQAYLEACGLTVLRIHNLDVLRDAEAVLLGIAKAAHVDLTAYYGTLFGPAQRPGDAAQATGVAVGSPLTPTPLPRERGTEFAAVGSVRPAPHRRSRHHRNRRPNFADGFPRSSPLSLGRGAGGEGTSGGYNVAKRFSKNRKARVMHIDQLGDQYFALADYVEVSDLHEVRKRETLDLSPVPWVSPSASAHQLRSVTVELNTDDEAHWRQFRQKLETSGQWHEGRELDVKILRDRLFSIR